MRFTRAKIATFKLIEKHEISIQISLISLIYKYLNSIICSIILLIDAVLVILDLASVVLFYSPTGALIYSLDVFIPIAHLLELASLMNLLMSIINDLLFCLINQRSDQFSSVG